ncbi:MAG: type II secretion system major pseudopilin GspG [Planctomycetales bacterium]|nr:type II secretion system major pseudopilin GspG [Planctomycetales bacterium]
MICRRSEDACRQTRRIRRAFTLLELMVVIVIIGLLAGAVTVSVRSYLIRGKQSVAMMEIAKICEALETYYSAYDTYPTSDVGLQALVEESDQFAAGLLSKVPLDPWNHPYEYVQPGRSGPYEVICYGADGQEGGEGADRDLSSDNLEGESS